MRPQEVFPTASERAKDPEFWNKRRLTYLRDEKYFDQEVRTGVCFFCQRDGTAQKSKKTYLHHIKYDHSDPLTWTIEVCGSCHWQIDKKQESNCKEYGQGN